MQEQEELKQEEIKDVVEPKAPEPEPIKPFATSAERVDALHEISVLQSLINTRYFLPTLDNGNHKTEQSKITKSTELNYFSNNLMAMWGKRCIELMGRVGA